MTLAIGFLPTAIQGAIQNGYLEARIYEALKPALLWRQLCEKKRHPGKLGEIATMTRPGLIAASTEASALRTAGQDPGLVARSIEQFSYQVKPYGKGLDIHLPSSALAAYNLFMDDSEKLAFQGLQTMNQICRGRIFRAYGGGDTYTEDNPGAVTAVDVKDCTGFDTVMVNGSPVPVSVSNPLTVTIGGTTRLVTACVADDASSPPTGPGTLTISVALDYAQYDRVLRSDAPKIVREASRATDRLLVDGDTATIATFRNAAAWLRNQNVPGINGLVGAGARYGVFVDPDTMNALFADDEFHDAIQQAGLTGPFAEGALGDYAGMRFMQQTEMPANLSGGSLQTTIHRSFMFGADLAIEAYIPEAEFEREVTRPGVASANHFKMALDAEGALTMVYRAPLDRAGEVVGASWLANVDYCIPTDANASTSSARTKRGVVIHTAGPA